MHAEDPTEEELVEHGKEFARQVADKPPIINGSIHVYEDVVVPSAYPVTHKVRVYFQGEEAHVQIVRYDLAANTSELLLVGVSTGMWMWQPVIAHHLPGDTFVTPKSLV